jgi:AAA15 family ATPase/GTPase
MDSIRIKNLHCLADTGEVPLKSINILVGANSSGKSSFLRTFPLFKQGLNINKRGPILWLSEDVDLGDFKTAVRKGEKNIEFQFRIKAFLLTVNIVEYNGFDFINKINVEFHDQKFQINISNKNEFESIIVNNETFKKDINVKIIDGRANILPHFQLADFIDTPDSFKQIRIRSTPFFNKELFECMDNLLANKISQKSILAIKSKIGSPASSKKAILKKIKEIESPKVWKTTVSNWEIDNDEFNRLNNRFVLSVSFAIIDNLNIELTSFYRNSSYIGPLRATAERYYRRQNLSLDSIDSRGINLPMFINDLSEIEKKDLKTWMLKYFDFYLYTDYSGGHIAISLINEDTKEKFNLADNGFGFSQILPIIILLWTLTSNRSFNRRRSSYFNYSEVIYYVIEQPELHLHPSMQAKLADVFVSAVNTAKENNVKLRLVIETHSETIINRIGQKISENELNKEDVTVALFHNKSSENEKNVSLSEFNDDGFLENWPIGFFNAY